jgi:formylglycine-generating enzyme required for sulfatase activity
MSSNPSYFKGNNHPVECVSWDDCQKFVERLSEMLTDQLGGRRFRLPTEAEWEYAARGGSQSMGYAYAGGNSLDGEVAWYEDNAGKTAHAVMQRQPNELGLFDMSGNVQEWCQDRYGQYAKGAQTDPKGAAKGFDRVVRGGSYSQGARECRVTYRGHKSASSRANGVGLRLAL